MPLWQILAVLWPFAAVVAALIVGESLQSADAHTAPDGTAGDLLAGQPTEVLVDDEQVRQLERTWLL